MTLSTIQELAKQAQNATNSTENVIIDKTKLEDHPEILVLFGLLVFVAVIFFCATLLEDKEQE